jgi:RimJ/RimL family protein N-acetyltransferase
MKIILKRVDKSDWNFIYDLRTNEKYTNNFYSKNSFSLEEHYAYISKQEVNLNFFHWIITNNDENIGYIRILDNDVSIMISEQYQNKGLGSQTLELVEKEAKSLGISKLIGRVMIDNESSKKIFEKNGYKIIMHWLEKNI